MIRTSTLLLAMALATSSCALIRSLTGNRVTGTCDGACAHYIDCKPGATVADRQRCDLECPQVFADRSSLSMFERLTCPDAVSYVDGDPPTTADTRMPAPAR